MQQQEIFEKIINIITPYLDSPCEIGMESDLSKDLLINSFDFINIVMEVEKAFQCSLGDEQMLHICLVKDLVQCLVTSSSR